MVAQVLAIVWYNESEYDHCKALFIDGYTLPNAWAEWNAQAEEIRRELTQQGIVVIPAFIDPDTFLDWCAERGLRPEHRARAAFASAEACRAVADLHAKRRP